MCTRLPRPSRRSSMGALAGLLLLAALPSCGGPGTRLVTVRAGQPAGGAVELEVKNLTDVPINNFYLAKSGAVSPALDADAPDGQAVWGADLLTAALPRGEQVRVPVNEPGRWDARALDRDGRYQHIASLKLESGGRYILELQESGWRVR